MSIDPENFIILFFFGTGILLCIAQGITMLNRAKGKKVSNLLIGWLLILTSITMLNGFLANAGIFSQFQQLYFLPLSYSFSFGPLTYLFIRSKTEASFTFERKHWLHFIPVAIQAGFFFVIGFRSAEYKSMIWRELYGPYLQYLDEGGFLIITSIYLYLSLQLLGGDPKENWRAAIHQWLKRFVQLFFVLITVITTYTLSDWIAWNVFETNIFNIRYLSIPLNLANAGMAIWLGYNAWLYGNQQLIIDRQISPKKISLDTRERVHQLLSEDKIFTNPDFDLSMLSKLIGKSRNELSTLFSSEGSSFNDTVNRYRIEEFLSLQKEHPEYSLEALALDVGFGSRSTFNRAFKKEKGMTPSEYSKNP